MVYFSMFGLGVKHGVSSDLNTTLVVIVDGNKTHLTKTDVIKESVKTHSLAGCTANGAKFCLSRRESHPGLAFTRPPLDGSQAEGEDVSYGGLTGVRISCLV